MKRFWALTAAFWVGITLWSCGNAGKNSPEASHPDYRLPGVAELSGKLADHPNDAQLYFQRGKALQKHGRDSLALEDYKNAVRLDSSKAAYYSAIGDLMFEHKDISGSVQWFDKAIRLDPRDPMAHLKFAKILLITKDYKRSFAEINNVLRQDVYNREAYLLKGLAYKDLKDTNKAISSFQTALQVSPEYAEAMVQLGAIYRAKGDPLALKYYGNAFKADTTDVYPLYAQGMYYQDRKEYELAKEAYRNCLHHNRQYADAYFNTGWILMQQDSLQQAIVQFRQATKADPGNAGAFYNSGLCQELLGNNSEAAADYRKALSVDPQYAEAREALARVE